LKKLIVFMAVLVFSLVFAAQSYAAGMGMSSTTSTDNTGNGSVLGSNRTGMGLPGITGTTGVSGTGMSNYGTTGYTSTSTPSSYIGTSSTYGTNSTNYGTNGTMRGFNYRANAATNNNNGSWGWLGLLGLLGLAGLRSNNREEHRIKDKH
jgi:MYXO-CTERM domain-containing protein